MFEHENSEVRGAGSTAGSLTRATQLRAGGGDSLSAWARQTAIVPTEPSLGARSDRIVNGVITRYLPGADLAL